MGRTVTRPTCENVDPVAHVMRVKAWHHRHYDCPGHYCRHEKPDGDGNRKPCPLPPPLPHFTSCPARSVYEPRIVDCGGCEDCQPGHHCHLNGNQNNCTLTGPVPDNAITDWANYELIAGLDARAALDNLNEEEP